jgi:hypothetical protein
MSLHRIVENRTKAEDEIKNAEQHEALKQTFLRCWHLTEADLPFIDSRLAEWDRRFESGSLQR